MLYNSPPPPNKSSYFIINDSNKRILGCRPGVIKSLLDKIFKDEFSVVQVAYKEDRIQGETTEKEPA